MTLAVAFAAGAALPVAVAAHEATHAGVAWLLGADSVALTVEWGWRGGIITEHTWAAGTALWRLYAANLAPLAGGVGIFMAVWLSGALEVLADQPAAVQAVGVGAWVVYSRVGPTDLRVPRTPVGGGSDA